MLRINRLRLTGRTSFEGYTTHRNSQLLIVEFEVSSDKDPVFIHCILANSLTVQSLIWDVTVDLSILKHLTNSEKVLIYHES